MKIKMEIPKEPKMTTLYLLMGTPLTESSSVGPDNAQVKKCQM